MTVYRGTCKANELANGIEIVTDVDFAEMAEGDELDVTMGDDQICKLAMSEPGDLKYGIDVALHLYVNVMPTLHREGPCRFRLELTEAQEAAVASARKLNKMADGSSAADRRE